MQICPYHRRTSVEMRKSCGGAISKRWYQSKTISLFLKRAVMMRNKNYANLLGFWLVPLPLLLSLKLFNW